MSLSLLQRTGTKRDVTLRSFGVGGACGTRDPPAVQYAGGDAEGDLVCYFI